MKNDVKPHQIGVITPYEGQHSYVVQYTQFNGTMSQKLYKQLKVAGLLVEGPLNNFVRMKCILVNL